METVANSYQETVFEASRNQKSPFGGQINHNAYRAENYCLTSA